MDKEAMLESIEEEAQLIESDKVPEEAKQATEQQPQPEPEPQPQPQPEEAFQATADLTVEVIKSYFRKKYADNPNIEDALKVWDTPFFASCFIPVLKKYNLSIFNLPVELVLLGGLWKLSSDMVDILKQGQTNAAKAEEE